jgi:nitroreductase
MQPQSEPRGPSVASSEIAKEAVRIALAAPSSHNSQPWLFRFIPGGIELSADRTRALPVVDPEDRELVISCGAVLHHVEVALAALGEAFRVSLLPDDTDPDLLATISLLGPTSPKPRALRLRDAIAKRRTTRFAFSERRPDPATLKALEEACAETGATLHFVEERDRATFAYLIAEADRYQLADPAFRAELARWLRPNTIASSDGIPGYSIGVGDAASLLAPLVVRTFDRGDGQAARDQELLTRSPVLAVIATRGDTVAARLTAGRALSATWLEATLSGLSASFLNQPLEIPELRRQVGRLLPDGLVPELVLRLGYYEGPPLRATPRRELREVTLGHSPRTE